MEIYALLLLAVIIKMQDIKYALNQLQYISI